MFRGMSLALFALEFVVIAILRFVFLLKVSRSYSEIQTVVVEDLNIKNMTNSAKGTTETPG